MRNEKERGRHFPTPARGRTERPAPATRHDRDRPHRGAENDDGHGHKGKPGTRWPSAAPSPAHRLGEGGHGRRYRGFAQDESDALMQGHRELDPEKLPDTGFTVQLAPRGFLQPLLEELGDRVITVMGRLVLARGSEPAAWAQNVWTDPHWIPVDSISDAARKLKAIQRNWRAHVADNAQLHRRAALIEEGLPHVSCRPLTFGTPAPTAALGAFTLWTPNLLLASAATTSPFPDGEVSFVENHTEPPGRAYLKLWEAFTLLGKSPAPGELCLDLGAAPGSWSWVLAGLGARVFSLDRAELADNVAHLPNVNHCLGSGFGLDPLVAGHVDWLFSDMICYPSRLLALVTRWIEADAMSHALCTLKFQADTDHETARAFAAIPGSRLMHLSCNRHELTWYWQAS